MIGPPVQPNLVFLVRTVSYTKTESTTATLSTPPTTLPQSSSPMELQDWLCHTTFGQLPWPRTTFRTPLWSLRVLLHLVWNLRILATFTKTCPTLPKLLGIRLSQNFIQIRQLTTAGGVTNTLLFSVFRSRQPLVVSKGGRRQSNIGGPDR